jgi:hypothetical protein
MEYRKEQRCGYGCDNTTNKREQEERMKNGGTQYKTIGREYNAKMKGR